MNCSNLRVLQSLPDGFLTCPATELYKIVPEPTVFHLDSRYQSNERLFVSILLHGDETAGLLAMQSLLSDVSLDMKRPLSLFVGNVDAARKGVRRLDGQTDFNRCWPGGEFEDSPEGLLMRQLISEMSDKALFASIDIHNNTGKNPHYGCINRLEPSSIFLASLFSPEIVYFIRPKGVQSMAFSNLCPSVTLECGSIGDLSGVSHAEQYVRTVLGKESLLPRTPFDNQMRVYHTMAQIKLPDHLSCSFDGGKADIMFNREFAYLNFKHLEPGTEIAKLKHGTDAGLKAIDENGVDKTEQYFSNSSDKLILKKQAIPAMLTTSEQAIRQDCLGYFMELLEI